MCCLCGIIVLFKCRSNSSSPSRDKRLNQLDVEYCQDPDKLGELILKFANERGLA